MNENKLLTHGSLFSGIGGFDLAAECAGFINLFHCDNDPFCRQTLQYHFPNTVSYEDITATDFTPFRDRITVLSGGFPCQPFSLAGKRKGTTDDRYLWPQMLRVIQEIRPTWIIGENVIGIASMVQPAKEVRMESATDQKQADHSTSEEYEFVLQTICRDLEQAGYSVQPFIIPACSVGAPHKRDRVWIVARMDELPVVTHTGGIGCFDGSHYRQGGLFSDNLHGDASQGESERQGRQCGIGTVDQTVGSASYADSNGCHPRGRMGDRESQDTTEWDRIQSDVERPCRERIVTHSGGFGSERRIDANGSRSAVQLCLAGLCTRSGSTERQLPNWSQFPTQPPIYAGDDGLPRHLVGRTFPHTRWRKQAVKACGNAIVPQVAYEILKAIYSIENSTPNDSERVD